MRLRIEIDETPVSVVVTSIEIKKEFSGRNSSAVFTRAIDSDDIDPAQQQEVIQNARVALQCMQMRTNEVSRDASMADNVKWILDHSPGAKIVLWAHNGHVSTGGYRGYEPMGAALRKMFGSQMLVFGFAFNEGSFQAI